MSVLVSTRSLRSLINPRQPLVAQGRQARVETKAAKAAEMEN